MQFAWAWDVYSVMATRNSDFLLLCWMDWNSLSVPTVQKLMLLVDLDAVLNKNFQHQLKLHHKKWFWRVCDSSASWYSTYLDQLWQSVQCKQTSAYLWSTQADYSSLSDQSCLNCASHSTPPHSALMVWADQKCLNRVYTMIQFISQCSSFPDNRLITLIQFLAL